VATIKEIQSTVKNILAAPYGVEFYILEMSDEVFSLHQLNIGQDKTYERIISQYKKQLKEVFLDTDSSTIQDIYDIDQRRDVFYQVEDVSSVSRLNAIDELLSVDTYDTDDFSQFNYSKIWGFLITIGNDEESITLFRKHYKMNTLKQNVFLLRFFDDSFSLVDNETNIRFDTDFHAFKLNNCWFVTDLKTFEREFKFEAIMIAKAQKSFSSLLDLEIIQENDALFETCLAKRTFARKVMRVLTSSQVIQKQISRDRILAFSKEFDAYSGKFHYAENGRIVLSTQKDFDLYLKLMNDDYLVSSLTETVYDTEVKKPED
jgi:hypothetical protein